MAVETLEDGTAELMPQAQMDPRITNIQPGGGFVMRLELAWGYARRAYLKAFRRGYVRRMQRLRRGDRNPAPHDVLDPRDLKFYRNQPGYHWDVQDDPFYWRDRLPFARAGLAELLFFSTLTFGGAAIGIWLALGMTGIPAMITWAITAALLVIGVLIVWFFRNPRRRIPDAPGSVVAPADGKVVLIERIEHDEHIGGPAVQIGIFLSIFNVHINRASLGGRVIGVGYRPGKFLNALRPESAQQNERLTLRMQETTAPFRRFTMHQITGALARRIVCWVKPGDALVIGQQFGMIKLGSRTELVIPDSPDLNIEVAVGDHIKAGSSLIARYGGVS